MLPPSWPGDERCFLFSVRPSLMLYLASGGNDNFQYLNISTETLPNGLVGEEGARECRRARAWAHSNAGPASASRLVVCPVGDTPSSHRRAWEANLTTTASGSRAT